jgi:hypothetical protein
MEGGVLILRSRNTLNNYTLSQERSNGVKGPFHPGPRHPTK